MAERRRLMLAALTHDGRVVRTIDVGFEAETIDIPRLSKPCCDVTPDAVLRFEVIRYRSTGEIIETQGKHAHRYEFDGLH